MWMVCYMSSGNCHAKIHTFLEWNIKFYNSSRKLINFIDGAAWNFQKDLLCLNSKRILIAILKSVKYNYTEGFICAFYWRVAEPTNTSACLKRYRYNAEWFYGHNLAPLNKDENAVSRRVSTGAVRAWVCERERMSWGTPDKVAGDRCQRSTRINVTAVPTALDRYILSDKRVRSGMSSYCWQFIKYEKPGMCSRRSSVWPRISLIESPHLIATPTWSWPLD